MPLEKPHEQPSHELLQTICLWFDAEVTSQNSVLSRLIVSLCIQTFINMR